MKDAVPVFGIKAFYRREAQNKISLMIQRWETGSRNYLALSSLLSLQLTAGNQRIKITSKLHHEITQHRVRGKE